MFLTIISFHGLKSPAKICSLAEPTTYKTPDYVSSQLFSKYSLAAKMA
jgi:hypothetical protein